MFHLPARASRFVLLGSFVLMSVTWPLFAATAHAAGFTTQVRLGFPAGDDWEPALAADRFGHVYVLYKHYDVAGQTTCPSCALHVLLQVSSDRGQMWRHPGQSTPRL